MSSLYEAMKHMMNEFDANKENANVCFGTVRSAKPLKIELENKLVLDESYFIVAQHISDYEIECELQTDEIAGFFVQHEGKQEVQVNHGKQKGVLSLKNALKTGDRVIVLKMEGGQQFVVLDRMEVKE